MSTIRRCRVSVEGADGITHSVELQAETLFEAAAAAMAVFREQGWAAEALTPGAKLRIEVTLPTVVHEVPVAAVERWLRGPCESEGDDCEEKRTHIASRQGFHLLRAEAALLISS